MHIKNLNLIIGKIIKIKIILQSTCVNRKKDKKDVRVLLRKF